MVRIQRLLGIILLGVLINSPATALLELSFYQNYLAKLIASRPAELSYKFFANYNWDHDPQVQSWLKQLDQDLQQLREFAYVADLAIVFAADGSIKFLDLENITEQDFDKFKNLITKLSDFRTQALPESLREDLWVYDLDAKWLYVARNVVPEPVKKLDDPIIQATLPDLKLDQQYTVKLLEPEFVDYPVIGQAILLQLDRNILDAKVWQVDKQHIYLDVHRILDINNQNPINLFAQQLVLSIDRPKNNSHEVLSTVIVSGLNFASQAGLQTSMASYGILPVGLAVVGMGAAVLKNNEEQLSFGLSRGDSLISRREK